jgi:hypothetical protein
MIKRTLSLLGALAASLTFSATAPAADQTVLGAGNAAAGDLASRSPLVRSARLFLAASAAKIHDEKLHAETVDATLDPATCVQHRAGVDAARQAALLDKLKAEGLVNLADDATFPGGLRAGVFPPLKNDGSRCPHLPQAFFSAPGSVFGGHHSFPGGLVVHESFNEMSDVNLASAYRNVYGSLNRDGLPEVQLLGHPSDDFVISQDIIVAAPIWHDWAKPIVFQWNADGTEFAELNFGGNGQTDNFGAAGDSRTGAHHILGVAETMKRGLAPDFVITQASAHSAPTSGNEYKVVNWLRAAAILADIDPVARGYLARDTQGRLRLPPLRALGTFDLNGAPGSPLNLLNEYTTHNLSDADFTFTGPAVTEAQLLLASLAPRFGYDPADAARYNTKYRNPALAYLRGERLTLVFRHGGIDAVAAEVQRLRTLGVL